ncbi:MAG: MotA/TolQ/ExbB proton channel family protein [Rhodospirillaceae bacterium]|nr:MotA/TolQ/ExbB proton channel family protein [Rhodospirillaceae bacterium]
MACWRRRATSLWTEDEPGVVGRMTENRLTMTPADPDTNEGAATVDRRPTARGQVIVAPMIISMLVSVAVLATFKQAYVPVEERAIDRYLANNYCLGIFTLFVGATVYAALQAWGLRIDRRLRQEAKSGSRMVCAVTGRDGNRATDPASIDHALSLLGYVAWALPLLGFIGTVIGISAAIGDLGGVMASGDNALGSVIDGLEFAFDTTLAGLISVIPVMLYTYPLRIWADRLSTDPQSGQP